MRTRILLVPTVLLLLFACSSEADNLLTEDARIASVAGTYKLTEMITEQPSAFNKGGSNPYNLIEELPCLEVYWTLHKDLTSNGTATQLLIDNESANYLLLACGDLETLPAEKWRLSGDKLISTRESYTIEGDQLIAERDPETNEFYRLVFTRQ